MKITFVLKDGTECSAKFQAGETILQAAEKAGIKMHSFCDGQGICGACHVIVENLNDKLPSVSEKEQDVLDRVTGSNMRSRLACQVILNDSLDGLRVKI